MRENSFVLSSSQLLIVPLVVVSKIETALSHGIDTVLPSKEFVSDVKTHGIHANCRHTCKEI